MHPATIEAWIQGTLAESSTYITSRKRPRDRSDSGPERRYNLRRRVYSTHSKQQAQEILSSRVSHRKLQNDPTRTIMPPALRSRKRFKGRQLSPARSEEQHLGMKIGDLAGSTATSPREQNDTSNPVTLNGNIGLPTPPLSFMPAGPAQGSKATVAYTMSIAAHDQQHTSSASRSGSPSKKSSKFGDLQFHADPVGFGSIDRLKHKEARALKHELRNISQAQGLLRSRPSVEADTDDDPDISFLDQAQVFCDDAFLTKTPKLEDLRRISEVSEELTASTAVEATWNARVHSQLLELALRASTRGKRVSCQMMTTASLIKEYQPRITDDRRHDRQIDFGLFVEVPSAALWTRRTGRSPNPSNDTTLRKHPLGVPIETKNFRDPKIQLAVWAFAIFRYLQDNLGQAPEFLPLLAVDNSNWRVIFAMQEQDTSTPHSSNKQVVLHDGQDLGSSNDIGGICKILAGLGCLYKWLDEQYGPWLEAAFSAGRT